MEIKIQRNSPKFRITFTVESDEPITEDGAYKIQTQQGFNPVGYGFGSFKVGIGEKLTHRATWTCSTSCD